MEFSETDEQPETDVISGVNDDFKAKLEKLFQDKNKQRDRLQIPLSPLRLNEVQNPSENVPVPPQRLIEVQNPLENVPVPPPRLIEVQIPLENLQLQFPLLRLNENQNPLENVNHPPTVPRCGISRPPPPLIFLPSPPPRTHEGQRPQENVSIIGTRRPLRVPPPPPPRPPETQNIISGYDVSLRSPIFPPVPPPRTNDTRKPTENVPILLSPPLPSPQRSSQSQSRPRKLERRVSSQSFRKRFPFLFAQKENEEGRNEPQESTATSSNPTYPNATDANEGNKERFNEADIDAYLLLEPAITALNIGLPLNEVKRAIKTKLELTGFGYQSGADLIEGVLKLKEEGYLQETDRHVPPRQVSEIEIQVCLRSEPALAALNLGLSLRRVKQAIKHKLERTGCGFSSGDALIEAALNIPEEEDLLVNSPEKSKHSDEEDRLCKICMDAEICVVFVQCGHLITCLDCSRNLKDCPVCRCPIESTVRTFLP